MKLGLKIHLGQLLDLENPHNLRAFAWSLPVAVMMGLLAFVALRAHGGLVAVAGALLAIAGAVVVFGAAAMGMSSLSSRGAMGFVAPSGRSTPAPDDYSYEKSLLARGDVAAAVDAIEVRMAVCPQDVALRLFAADAYARHAGDPSKAERLYLQTREMPGISSAQDYLATNRLIDLYTGVLDDTARAMAELERLRVRHAGSTAAAHAEQVLRQLRVARADRP
jgi:hypothetical protein